MNSLKPSFTESSEESLLRICRGAEKPEFTEVENELMTRACEEAETGEIFHFIFWKVHIEY